MSKSISIDQSHSIIQVLANNVDWNALDGDLLQEKVIKQPREAGKEFTNFLQNGARVQIVGDYFRESGELRIEIPALPRPTLGELQKKYDFIRSIESDDSPTEPVTLVLGTVLHSGESSINGTEYEYRLKSIGGKFGYQQGIWLVEHQDELPEFKKLCGEVYIDLPGLIVLGGDGRRSFPCLREYGGRWNLNWFWLGNVFRLDDRIARSGK